MKKLLFRSAISFFVGIILVFAISWLRGVFKADDVFQIYKYLCDGFFSVSAVMLCLGILILCTNEGSLDMLKYGTRKFFKSMFSSRKHLNATKETFVDYRQNRMNNPKAFMHLILSGAALLLFAIIFLLLYLKN